MRGLNRVIISGKVYRVLFSQTPAGTPACSFKLLSDYKAPGRQLTTSIKVNVYGEKLVGLCQDKLKKDVYLLVEGELMNRDGELGELTEVRARELIFCSTVMDDEILKGDYTNGDGYRTEDGGR